MSGRYNAGSVNLAHLALTLTIIATVISACSAVSPAPLQTFGTTPPPETLQLSPSPVTQSQFGGGTGLIAFSSPRDGESAIFTISVETGDVSPISGTGSRLNQPTWSPDGRRVGYVHWSGGGAQEIWFMNSLGAERSRVTSILGHRDIEPAWSPDGTKIAFASSRDTYLDSTGDEVFVMNVYVVDLETLRQIQLTDSVTWDTDPDWAPDGQSIVWQGVKNNNNEILLMSSDGNEIANLTRNAASDANPAWSPDGSRIAFVSDRSGNEEIYVMDSDGSNVLQLTSNPERDKAPAWSPDGEWLAYQAEYDANFDIYIMLADGTQQTRLTTNLDFDGFPSWQPPISGAALGGIEPNFDRDSLPEFISFRTMSWINEHAVPLLTREPIGFTTDLEPLVPIIGSSRLVDLGGQAFSTDEDFTLRHRIIEFLVQVMDFDVIVLEIAREPALLLDRYLNLGEGNPAIAIEMLEDPRWRNSAFLDLIEWIRKRNHDPNQDSPIHIYGIASLLPALDVFAERAISSSVSPGESAFRSLAERENSIRDNTRWVIEQISSDSKLILWGSDFDLLETAGPVPGDYAFALAAQPSLGELFGSELGEQLFRIGLILGRGLMTEVNTDGSLEAVSIGGAPAGSFEWMADGTGMATFLLPDLSGEGSMLDRRILGRTMFSRHPEATFLAVNLAEAYDALIYANGVRPARTLMGTKSPDREGPATTCAIRSSCFE